MIAVENFYQTLIARSLLLFGAAVKTGDCRNKA